MAKHVIENSDMSAYTNRLINESGKDPSITRLALTLPDKTPTGTTANLPYSSQSFAAANMHTFSLARG